MPALAMLFMTKALRRPSSGEPFIWSKQSADKPQNRFISHQSFCTAIASISISPPLGSLATSTQDLAGADSLKYWA